MAKNLVLSTGLGFHDRLDALRAANTDAHYDAALKARIEFEERMVAAVSARAMQVLDAITAN